MKLLKKAGVPVVGGNVITGPYDNRVGGVYLSSAFGGVGNIYIPDQQGLIWQDPADGANIFNIRMWRGHDAVRGEAIIESSWRIALLGQGPIQFGHNDALPTAQGLHITCGASSSNDTIKHSKPVSWQTKRYNGGSEQHGYVIVQANSLTDNSDSTVLRFSICENPVNGQWDGFNGGGGTYTKGLSNGTDMAEFAATGIWHAGTNPTFSTLDASGSTVTWTLDKHLNTQHAKVTLPGVRTLAFSGLLPGMRGTLVVTQDTTGGRTLTLPSGSKTPAGGDGVVTLTSAANAVDVLDWFYDGTNIFWRSVLNFTGSMDADALAFFSASGITDSTQKSAVNALVLGLKNASLWNRFAAIYPFVGGDSTKHSFNLKAPGSYQIAWSGTVTHDANGITGNGSTGYGNTGLAASAVGSTTSQFIYVYNKTTLPTANGHLLSAANAAGGVRSELQHYKPGGTDYVAMGGLNYNASATKFTDISSNLKGHIAANITDASNQVLWFNAAASTVAVAASARSTSPFFLLAKNNGGSPTGYSNANLAFAAIGETLTAGEWTTFKGLIDTFQAALSRNV